jgi:hypothetical protein
MSASTRVPWTKQRQIKAEAARARLREIARSNGDAKAVLDVSDRSNVLIDLIARADVGLEFVVIAPRDRGEAAADLVGQWERRYNRLAAVQIGGEISEDGAVAGVLADWSEDDIQAYVQAHRTPRAVSSSQAVESVFAQPRRQPLALASC